MAMMTKGLLLLLLLAWMAALAAALPQAPPLPLVKASQPHAFARVQQPAPAFSADAVSNLDFVKISLSDYAGKWLVLFFYPLDFTFVCPTEIISFSDHADEFRAKNAEVVGVSVDSKHSHLAWIQQDRKTGGLGKMNIPLISDITKQISYDYGVLLESGPEAGLAVRGTFIIDPKGIVRHISMNDLGVGRSVAEVIRLLDALQFNAAHGEVCPANWNKGDRTMVADPFESKEYFKATHDKEL